MRFVKNLYAGESVKKKKNLSMCPYYFVLTRDIIINRTERIFVTIL